MRMKYFTPILIIVAVVLFVTKTEKGKEMFASIKGMLGKKDEPQA